ncbi:MAG: DUF6383 domain-containing protein [Tannerellaceae bacterium]|nr:DUF6383 domain-containing protein [Tannerellaceae bacterium]
MKKKFSTFLAGFALLGAVFSVNAQLTDHSIELRSVDTIPQLNAVESVSTGGNAGLFVLSVADDAGDPTTTVLGINSATGQIEAVDMSTDSFSLNSNILWCVDVEKETANRPYTYTFLNKGQGEYLGLDIDDEIKGLATGDSSSTKTNGSEVTKWSLSSMIEAMVPGAMYSALPYQGDSVVGFVVNGEDVVFIKQSFDEALTGDASFTTFVLAELEDVLLTEDQFNTKLSTLTTQQAQNGITLTFSKDVLNSENPFETALFAVAPLSGTTSYVSLTNKDGEYLVADTAYHNEKGTKFIKFNWYAAEIVSDTTDTTLLAQRGSFALTYNPTYDKLYIQVEEVTLKQDSVEYWADDDSSDVYINAYVQIQDLFPGEYDVVTVGNWQNFEIYLGIESCTPVDDNDKISLDNDLYLIKDGNKYLAVPIHGDSIASWVTIEDNYLQDPWQMPAFQWVVEKTQTSSSVSSVKITNREFEDVSLGTVQLYANNAVTSGVTILNGDVFTGSTNIRESYFVADPANYKADEYLGYRKFDDDSIRVTSYTLRYIHGLSDDTYVYGDSILAVDANGNKNIFSLDILVDTTGVSTVKTYGYVTDAVEGLAQLKRQAYRMKVKSVREDKYVGHNIEDQYIISAYNTLTAGDTTNNNAGRVGVFYFKANNYKEDNGLTYYALVDTFGYYGIAADSLRKVSVSDVSIILKGEEMTETRTSAFAIEINDTPVYRNFNVDLPEGTVAPNNGSDTICFYERYRKEYLQMEGNENFMVAGIDFLGIDALEKAPNGVAFIVDTAWVGRGLGYIKPQYLISIDRNDQEFVDVIPCPLEHNHGYDKDGNPLDAYTCSHATPAVPAFNRGKYLVNFRDSADDDYKWKKFDRAGFVDAAHIGDSLYILKGMFAGLTNDYIDTAAIKAADARATTVVDRYIVDLTGDQHKTVTWSMRYFDIENTAINNEFLIESMPRDIADEIQPIYAQWLKMNNGCLVLSDATESKFDEITTGGDDALIFNVVKYEENDDDATDDEVIAETSVVVIAGQGSVTVKNAAGKKVSISNILGQTVANTVVTSDNVTIAVPAGVVVVSVEGEAAVKAIVK